MASASEGLSIDLTKEDGNDSTDELAIDSDKVSLLNDHKAVLKERFDVDIALGLTSTEASGSKRWISFIGFKANRSKAKMYVKTLCNPLETLMMPYPKEMTPMIRNPVTLRRLEEQTKTVLLFPKDGEIVFHGPDTLAVALACSAVEDAINQHIDRLKGQGVKSPGVTARLDSELRRLSSQEEGASLLEPDLMHMNDAVKRSILTWMRDSDSEETPQQGVPVHEMESIQLNKGASSSSVSSSSNHMVVPKSSIILDSEDEDKVQQLRSVALSKGFSDREIQQVVDEFGACLCEDEFLEVLRSNKFQQKASTSTSSLPRAPSDTQLKNDPSLRPHTMNHERNILETSKHLKDYLDQRCRDHAEEAAIDDREALMRKNEDRQELLREAYKRREEEKQRKKQPQTLISLSDSDDSDVIMTGTSSSMDTLDDFTLPDGYVTTNRKKAVSAHNKRIHHSSSPQSHNTQKTRSPSPKKRSISPGKPPAIPSAYPQNPPQSSQDPSNLRYVVIDGSNVAVAHGNRRIFSCKGIKICIDYFKSRGHKQITAFVPQWRTRAPTRERPISDQHLLEELRDDGHLVFTPARRVPSKNIVCYDDKFILRLAEQTDGVMISNDNYRDLWGEKPEWRDIIENRLVGYSFVGDIFMLPDDPLGRDGPSLDAFLSKNPQPQMTSQPRSVVTANNIAAHGASTSSSYNMPPPNHVPYPGAYYPQQQQVQQHRPYHNQVPQQAYQQRQPNQSVRGRGAGNSRRGGRTLEETKQLTSTLNSVFEGSEKIIAQVLQSNPAQRDIHVLSEMILHKM